MPGRKGLILAAVLASTGFLGTGCASSTTGGLAVLPRVSGLEKTTITAAISPVLDSAGFFVAMREGLFAQEGLTVNYTPAHGDTVISGAVKGQYDVIATNYVSYIQAQVTRAANLRVIAEASLLQPGGRVIMTMPGSKVRTLKELTGHVLGVNADANVGFLLAASVLTENGIKLSVAGRKNAVGFPSFSMPYPDAAPALVSGKVAAAVVSEPFVTQAEESYGAVPLADLDSGATEQFPMEGYATTASWARANPRTMRAFLIALEAGQQIADTDRQAVESAFVGLPQGAGHIDRVTAAVMALNVYPLGVDAVRLQRVADVMQQFGFLKKRFDISGLLG
ncbi:ABC transporter substrate-binding protein [Trebonia kvetii]|nr:ABC transporter substrate-binding protein [Trebonia kvetii]